MNLIQSLEQMRNALQKYAASLPETDAMEVACIYPPYAVGKAYAAGEYFTDGFNNVGDPQLYAVLQAHTSAAEWPPASTPSLYKAVGVTPAGYPEWSQPVGAGDAYATGDIVDFDGALYISLIDGNVWSPTAYPAGWQVYEA